MASGRGTGRTWRGAAAAALLLASALGAAATPARAADPPQLAQGQPTSFDIAPQPLPQTLIRFSEQSGVELAFDASLARGLSSPGISGTYTPEQALSLLLAGTGLDYRFTNATTVTLYAQAGSGTTSGGPLTLPALTITGEKLQRSYQQTFTSVGVVEDEQIEVFQLDTLQKAFELMANVRQFPSRRGEAGFTIRGLSSEGVTQAANSTPLTSIVIDGATQSSEGNRRGARVLWDVEQVEVFRGPQSTLQGRNSLAGTVSIETKDPTYWREAALHGVVGNEETLEGGFMLSGPIVENQVAFRLSGIAHSSDRGIEYTLPGNENLDDDEFHQIRGKLLVEPEALPGFSLELTASSTYDKPGVYAVTGPDYFDEVFDPTDAIPGAGGAIEFRKMHLDNYVMEAAYAVDDYWTLRSITAFIDTDVEIGSAEGSSFLREDTRDGDDITQELRVEFGDETRALSGVAGVFYGHYKQDTDSLVHYDIPFLGQVLVQDGDFGNRTTSYAAFADARWRFWEGFSLLLGGRVQHDKVSNSSDGLFLDLTDPFAGIYYTEDYDISTEYTVFLPKVGIAYDITPEHSVAFTVSRGYRAGYSEFIVGVPRDVQPEFLWDYELSYRGELWDGRLLLGANAFYYDYSDQQVVVEDRLLPGQGITVNAGSSSAYGAELEARLNLDFGLQVFGSLGLLHTEFEDFETVEGNFDGNEFPEAPAVTAALGAIYRHESGFFAAGDVSYTSSWYTSADIANTPARELDSYTLVNGRFGYDSRYFTVSVFADNMLNEEYLTGIGFDEATLGEGRTFGLVFDLHY